jgi:hypothetical protein
MDDEQISSTDETPDEDDAVVLVPPAQPDNTTPATEFPEEDE